MWHINDIIHVFYHTILLLNTSFFLFSFPFPFLSLTCSLYTVVKILLSFLVHCSTSLPWTLFNDGSQNKLSHFEYRTSSFPSRRWPTMKIMLTTLVMGEGDDTPERREERGGEGRISGRESETGSEWREQRRWRKLEQVVTDERTMKGGERSETDGEGKR